MILKLPTNQSSGPDGFIGEFYQIKELICVLLKPFQKLVDDQTEILQEKKIKVNITGELSRKILNKKLEIKYNILKGSHIMNEWDFSQGC